MEGSDRQATRKSFRKFVRCLEGKLSGRVAIVGGTLLGWIREGGLAVDGSGIDFAVSISHYTPSLIPDLRDAGFVLIDKRGSVEDGLRLKFHDGMTPVRLFFVYAEASKAWFADYFGGRQIRYVHDDFSLRKIALCGMDVMIPSDPKQHLSAHYGRSWPYAGKGWHHLFSPPNAKPHGSLAWRLGFACRRALRQLGGPLCMPAAGRSMPVKRIRDEQCDGACADGGVVFVDGAFDLLHPNHVAFLEYARSLGDYLVVAVVSDENVSSYKRLPVLSQEDRLRMVRSLSIVDEAFILTEPLIAETMEAIIRDYSPSKIVYSGGAEFDFYRPAEQRGLMVRPAYLGGLSTTEIIKRIRSRPDLQSCDTSGASRAG